MHHLGQIASMIQPSHEVEGVSVRVDFTNDCGLGSDSAVYHLSNGTSNISTEEVYLPRSSHPPATMMYLLQLTAVEESRAVFEIIGG